MDLITEKLHDLLSEFHKLTSSELRNVWHVWSEGCLDKILLEFDQVSLVVEAEIDYDTIEFSAISSSELSGYAGISASHLEPWSGFIGKTFGWGWATFNQQNYLDGILLSFGGLEPNILLNVIASTITVSAVHPISEESLAPKLIEF